MKARVYYLLGSDISGHAHLEVDGDINFFNVEDLIVNQAKPRFNLPGKKFILVTETGQTFYIAKVRDKSGYKWKTYQLQENLGNNEH